MIDKEAQRAVEQVDLLGVKADGSTVNLGKIDMPPKMKARELATEQFGHFEDGDCSDADLCFCTLEKLIEHMQAAQSQLAEGLRAAELDGKRLDWIQAHPSCRIEHRKRGYAVLSGFTNYEYELHQTLREAIDAAMEETAVAKEQTP